MVCMKAEEEEKEEEVTTAEGARLCRAVGEEEWAAVEEGG
jgi:hypothetical protein